MAIAKDSLIGTVVAGKYEVLRLIGRGGMGSVYEVRNTRIGRSYALKVLSAEFVDDPTALARFRREVHVVAALRHPNIPEVIDSDTLPDGSPYLLMEYLRGRDLSQRLRAMGPLDWSTLSRFGDEILSAISVAHRAGVVHRDLKPQNIFLSVDDANDEHAKLLDFGVSKVGGGATALTGADAMVGTLAYMAPEQADSRPEDVGPATDCWALGSILFEMATGQQAFGGKNAPAILYRICHGSYDRAELSRVNAPSEFIRLIEDCLSHEPTRRVSDVDTMRQRLRTSLEGVIPQSLPATPAPPSLRGPRPNVDIDPFGATLLPESPRTDSKRPESALPTPRQSTTWIQRVALMAVLIVAVAVGAWWIFAPAHDEGSVLVPPSMAPLKVAAPQEVSQDAVAPPVERPTSGTPPPVAVPLSNPNPSATPEALSPPRNPLSPAKLVKRGSVGVRVFSPVSELLPGEKPVHPASPRARPRSAIPSQGRTRTLDP